MYRVAAKKLAIIKNHHLIVLETASKASLNFEKIFMQDKTRIVELSKLVRNFFREFIYYLFDTDWPRDWHNFWHILCSERNTNCIPANLIILFYYFHRALETCTARKYTSLIRTRAMKKNFKKQFIASPMRNTYIFNVTTIYKETSNSKATKYMHHKTFHQNDSYINW